MLSFYDYAVIAVYFALMIAIGAIFRKINKNTSDYFRGGGKLLWWIVGATAFMTQFSAWTFTGAASKAYENGIVIFAFYIANAAGFFVGWLWTARRVRQMRIITALEGIRQRWGGGNEQFFTWLQIPVGILYAGIALNSVAVILSAVFGLPFNTTMLGAGLVVIFTATVGGSWAATAGDFMQMIVLMAVTCVAAVLALHAVGGVGEFVHRVPSPNFVWGEIDRSGILWLWVFAVMLKQVLMINNMSEGYRYLCAKDDQHARRGALLATILFIVGPLIWFIPPMVARILYPALHAVPALHALGSKASEGAYLAVALMPMPKGMLGLMVTGLFAATISNMDTGLNKNTGIFIRSFYLRVIRPQAAERELLVASKLSTLIFGVMVVLSGFYFSHLHELSLFNLMMQFSGLVSVPVCVPLLWGIFYKRTPSWSGWSTVAVCLLVSLVVGNLDTFFGPDAYQRVLGADFAVTRHELPDVIFLLSVVGNLTVGSAWFFTTSLWYGREPAAFQGQVETFFKNMRTPVDFAREQGENEDQTQLRTLGKLCFVYGGFVVLLALIPNPPIGRIGFLMIGGIIGAVGMLLLRASRNMRQADAADKRRQETGNA